MIGVNAKAIITAMQNEKAVWNWAIDETPSKTMSPDNLTCDLERTITTLAHCASLPKQAIGGWKRLRPECS
jgi:hypothetical protein